jgi:hypothetical protein
MKKNLILSAFLVLGLGLLGLNAQEASTATGGEATGTGGTVSFSVGQLMFTVHNGSTGYIVDGVQQPYEISVVTGIETNKGITLTVSAYPNPTSDLLTLRVEPFQSENLSYMLFDAMGKLLQRGKLTAHETPVSMSLLVPAIYFLRVIDNGVEVKTFKIIKN